MTAYLSTKLEGGGDIKTLIQNDKVFKPAWPDPVGIDGNYPFYIIKK